jgi:glutamate 5-kinase
VDAVSDYLDSAKRVVVKVGSALLVDSAAGQIKREWLASLVADVAALKKAGKDVILVSSGAIALGRRILGLKDATLHLEESQAAAAAGQVRLAQAYVDAFEAHGMVAAQILLTLEDTEARRRYLNARETLRTLLALKAVPVINENDTVATTEIRFGDNDRLAARVASMAEADCLILLSDIDGLYTANPQRVADARHIPEVATISKEIEDMAEGPLSKTSKGGMESKIVAAKIATQSGAATIIVNGQGLHPLHASRTGRKTIFLPHGSPAAARKRWIGGGLTALGALTVDDGAEKALFTGKSLLPAGVTSVSGEFERGDAVKIVNRDGRELARGLVAYSAAESSRVIGKRSVEIEAILGYRGRDEIVHRDDMALTGANESKS